MPLSTTRPSICENIGEWVASSSLLYTFPGERILMGGFLFSITLICPAEVWVLKSSSSEM